MNFPNELIQKVLLNLPPRSLAQCSYVCRSWYCSTRDPVFYHSIVIYSSSQLYKFIELATTLKVNGHFIGHWVRKVRICYPSENHNPSYEDLKALHLACPNIRYLNSFLLPYETFAFPYMEYLTKGNNDTSKKKMIKDGKQGDDGNGNGDGDGDGGEEGEDENENSPASMNMNIKIKENREWLDDIYDHAISLQMTVSPEDNDPVFYSNQDEHLRYHKELLDSFNFNIEELINQTQEVAFHGKVLGFTRQFDTLKELHLDLSPFSHYNSTSMFELDERTLDAIHLSCPALESLNLYDFHMNYSEYSSNLYTNDAMITHYGTHYGDFSTTKPCYQLKTFRLRMGIVLRPECFMYLSKKYPQLTTLDLHLEWDDVLYSKKEEYVDALYNMIIGFEHLKDFKVDDMLFTGHFPYDKLFSWLSTNPKRLESIGIYSTDVVYIENQYKEQLTDGWENYEREIKLRRAYLDHLTEFTFRTASPMNILRYFLKDYHSTIASCTITTLRIIGNDYKVDNFYFYEWMDAFPNLEELALQKMCVTEDDSKCMDDDNYYESLISLTTTLTIKKQYPKLKSLQLNKINIKLKDHLNEICQVCPSLSTIILENIGCVDYQTPLHVLRYHPPTFEEKVKEIKKILLQPSKEEFVLIDAPHLKLNKLFMHNLQYGGYYADLPKKKRIPVNLTINEIGYDNNIIKLSKKTISPSFKTIKINCHSVGVLVFEDGNDQ